MLSLSFSESTGSISPIRVRLGAIDPKFMEKIWFLKRKLNRGSRCHFRNLRGRFPPCGFAQAELTPNSLKNEGFLNKILIDALVVIFGIYGVHFPPTGSRKRSWPRIHWKMNVFFYKILIDALVVIFGISMVDFPPTGSRKQSLPRIHWKMKVFLIRY